MEKNSVKSGLSLAFWLNLSFSIIELIGGFFTNSTAIIADAFHDFIDAVAIGLAVWMEKVSTKKRTPGFSYGYKRFSLLSAVGMSVFLLVGMSLMIISAVKSFFQPEEVNSVGMLWLALLGILINGFAFLRIKQSGGHSHHGHSHSHGSNFNSRAIMLHLLEDILGWVAVLAGATVMYFTNWYWIDGVLTIAIALFIGFNAVKNLINTMKVILQSTPENVNVEKMIAELNGIKGVENIHDVHVWSMDGNYNVGSLHAVVNVSDENEERVILESISRLMEKHHIQHPTIQIEKFKTHCMLQKC